MTITAMRQAKQGEDEVPPVVAAFWDFSAGREKLSEAERLQQIREGFAADLVQPVKATFSLPERSLEILLNASISTLERRRRERKVLDPVASERLDRIAMVCQLAEEVFESRLAAADWMSRANRSLGGQAPIMLCETEIGAKQVRRVLNALDWGGAA